LSHESNKNKEQDEKDDHSSFSLIVFDLDGTLVDKSLEIKQRDLHYIRKVKQQKVKITLATGRTFRSALSFIQQLNIDSPVIVCNGASIIEPVSRRILVQESVSIDITRFALSKSEAYSLDPLIYVDPLDGLPCASEFTQVLKDYVLLEGFHSVQLENLEKLIQRTPPIKVQIVGDREPLRKLKQELLETYPTIPVIMTQDDYIEIMPAGISKGEALRRLCSIMNIPLIKTVTFGDALNDSELLDLAGLGIAMCHAPEELRKVADRIFPDVSSALKSIFL
jgi:Cof subfamily protein (haloacid dehalogenase superfamily)